LKIQATIIVFTEQPEYYPRWQHIPTLPLSGDNIPIKLIGYKAWNRPEVLVVMTRPRRLCQIFFGRAILITEIYVTVRACWSFISTSAGDYFCVWQGGKPTL